jgi:threonine dehydrogenase-like Zn-dependent dehydrogenase
MKALLVTHIGKLAIAEIPLPQLRAYEALVEVEACGICNSTDHKLLTGQFVPGPFPTALGHESTGKIVRVGERVRYFQPGQRVLRSVLFDRHVPGGRATWGGFSEYAIVVDSRAVREDGASEPLHWSAAKQQVVPETIKPAQAVAMITVKETLSCLQNFGVTAGSAVAVVGTGPVGQAFAFEARLLGAQPVVVFGRRPIWRERFDQLGIHDYVVGEDWPQGVSQTVAGGGFSHVVEAVGSRAALSLCLKLAGTRGKVGLYGIPPENAPYDPAERADPRVGVPRVEEADVHDLMLDWVSQGKINLDQWYSDVLPWTEYVRGFEMVDENHAAKVVLAIKA